MRRHRGGEEIGPDDEADVPDAPPPFVERYKKPFAAGTEGKDAQEEQPPVGGGSVCRPCSVRLRSWAAPSTSKARSESAPLSSSICRSSPETPTRNQGIWKTRDATLASFAPILDPGL